MGQVFQVIDQLLQLIFLSSCLSQGFAWLIWQGDSSAPYADPKEYFYLVDGLYSQNDSKSIG